MKPTDTLSQVAETLVDCVWEPDPSPDPLQIVSTLCLTESLWNTGGHMVV